MDKSQSIKGISLALITFHKEVGKVKKDANNPFFKSKYASLSNILDSIKEPLNIAGLSFVQFPENENELTTILMHAESAEYLQSTYKMTPTKNDPQGLGSAITYQRRYALGAILGLNIDEDDDANQASTPVKPVQKPINKPKQSAKDELKTKVFAEMKRLAIKYTTGDAQHHAINTLEVKTG